MSKRTILLALALLAAVTWLLLATDPAEPRPGGEFPKSSAAAPPVEPLHAQGLREGAASEPGAVTREELEPVAAGSHAPQLAVQVLRADRDEPVPGTPVVARWRVGIRETVEERGVTGADGWWRAPVEADARRLEVLARPSEAPAAGRDGDSLEAVRTSRWSATRSARAGSHFKTLAPGEDVEIVFRARRAGTVHGTVVDTQGRVVPGARVVAWRDEDAPPAPTVFGLDDGFSPPSAAQGARFQPAEAGYLAETTADARGSFTLQGVYGRVSLLALAPGTVPSRTAHLTASPAVPLRDVRLGVARARTVPVTVQDGFGLPIPDGRIWAVPGGSGVPWLQQVAHETAYDERPFHVVELLRPEDGGRKTLEGLTHGEWTILFMEGAYVHWQGDLRPGDRELTITVPDY